MATVVVGTSDTTTIDNADLAADAFTPAANDLLIAIGLITGNTSGTFTDSQGLGFTQVGSIALKNSSSDCLVLSVANTLAANVSTVVTLGVGGTSTGAAVMVYRVSGMSRTNINAIRSISGVLQQGIQNNITSLGSAPAPTLPGTSLTTNPIITAVINGTTTPAFSPPPGFTQFSGGVGYINPNAGMASARINSGFVGTTTTWGTASASPYASMVIELDTSIPGLASGGTSHGNTVNQVHSQRRKIFFQGYDLKQFVPAPPVSFQSGWEPNDIPRANRHVAKPTLSQGNFTGTFVPATPATFASGWEIGNITRQARHVIAKQTLSQGNFVVNFVPPVPSDSRSIDGTRQPMIRRVFRYQGYVLQQLVPPIPAQPKTGWESYPIPCTNRHYKQTVDPAREDVFSPPPPAFVPWGFEDELIVLSCGRPVVWDDGEVPVQGSPPTSEARTSFTIVGTLPRRVFRYQSYGDFFVKSPDVAQGANPGWESNDIAHWVRVARYRETSERLDSLLFVPPPPASGQPGWETHNNPQYHKQYFRYLEQHGPDTFLRPAQPPIILGWESNDIPRRQIAWLFKDKHELWHINIPAPLPPVVGWESNDIPAMMKHWLFRDRHEFWQIDIPIPPQLPGGWESHDIPQRQIQRCRFQDLLIFHEQTATPPVPRIVYGTAPFVTAAQVYSWGVFAAEGSKT